MDPQTIVFYMLNVIRLENVLRIAFVGEYAFLVEINFGFEKGAACRIPIPVESRENKKHIALLDR